MGTSYRKNRLAGKLERPVRRRSVGRSKGARGQRAGSCCHPRRRSRTWAERARTWAYSPAGRSLSVAGAGSLKGRSGLRSTGIALRPTARSSGSATDGVLGADRGSRSRGTLCRRRLGHPVELRRLPLHHTIMGRACLFAMKMRAKARRHSTAGRSLRTATYFRNWCSLNWMWSTMSGISSWPA